MDAKEVERAASGAHANKMTEEYAEYMNPDRGPWGNYYAMSKRSFIAGVEWQKEQEAKNGTT